MKPSRPKLKGENDALAKRLQSDYVRLKAANEPPSKAAPEAGLAASSGLDHGSPPTEAISEQDVEALFKALLKGSARHLGRQPTVSELVRLVEVIKARRLDALVTVARSGELDVHWDGNRWVFGPTPKPLFSEQRQDLPASEVA